MPEQQRVTTWTKTQVLDLVRAEHDTHIDDVVWVGSGHWSDCFAYAVRGKSFVVRIGRHVADFRRDQWAAQHRASALPVPVVSTIGPVGCDWFAISERAMGVPLEQAEHSDQLVNGVADLLEALRNVDLDGTTGWGRWDATGVASETSWADYLLAVAADPPDSRVHGWKAALRSRPVLHDRFVAGYQRLSALADVEPPRSLVHNDLLHGNVHVIGTQITGVFDWGNALFGDHLYDVAIFCFWQPWLPQVRWPAMIAALHQRWFSPERRVLDGPRRFEACLLHIGLEHMAYHAFLENWDEVRSVADRVDELSPSDWLSP